jgi:hypothetical protein
MVRRRNDAFGDVAVDGHLTDVVALDQPKNEVIDDGRLILVRPPALGRAGNEAGYRRAAANL